MFVIDNILLHLTNFNMHSTTSSNFLMSMRTFEDITHGLSDNVLIVLTRYRVKYQE